MDEVRKTIEMGYGLMNVFEFWEYEITCFERRTNSGGLFAEYVNMFLKLKQESPGYASWVQSEDEKETISTITGAQKELLWTRHRFPKMRVK